MARLVCDPQVGVVSYDIEINGVTMAPFVAQPDGSASFDLANEDFPVGTYSFRLRAGGSNNSWSDWCPPFVATKHATSTGLKIVS